MNIIQFLVANWDSVLVVLAFLVLVAVLIKRGETKILKQILFNLVTQAEKQFGSGTGSLKYAAVADWIYQRIPAILKLLFTSKDIETMIESVLEEAKKAWGTNENLQGYIETPTVENLLAAGGKIQEVKPAEEEDKTVRLEQKRTPPGAPGGLFCLLHCAFDTVTRGRDGFYRFINAV